MIQHQIAYKLNTDLDGAYVFKVSYRANGKKNRKDRKNSDPAADAD